MSRTKKSSFASPCRLGGIETPFNLAANFSTVHTRKRNNPCRRASITGILFSKFLFSVLSRQSWRQGRGTDLHLRCNSRIISWVSTATFQLFGMFSLVSSSPYCVLFTNTLYVTTRLYSTRKHIKQNKNFFILAHASPPNGLTAHCEKPNRKKKKEIRPFHASFRHSRGAFYPCSIAKHRPLESPRMGDSVILGSPQRKPENFSTANCLLLTAWLEGKVSIFSKWELICVTKILISHFRQGASELFVLHRFL